MKSLLRGQPRLACCVAFLALLLSPDALALQSLCQNSPENPTVVLGLIGAAAAGYPLLRDRIRALFKRNSGTVRQEDRT